MNKLAFIMRRLLIAIFILLAGGLSAQKSTGLGFRIALENNGLVIGGADQIINGIKLNLINTDYNEVRGINVCALQMSNTRSGKDIVFGANIGFVALRGNTYGFSFYPMGDFQDEVRGFSGGIINSGNLRSGVSGALFALKTFDKGLYGVSGSLVYIKSKKIRGFSAAPFIIGDYKNYREYTLDFRGTGLSFLMAASYLDGVSISFCNWTRIAHGVNIGFLNASQRISGVQWGLANFALQEIGKDYYVDENDMNYKLILKRSVLFQFGLVNETDQQFTTQFGLVNVTHSKYCVQVGLININKANKDGLKVLPFVNWNLTTEARAEKKRIKQEYKEEKKEQHRLYKENKEKERARNRAFREMEKEARKKRKSLR
ncbi:hypothetical protein KFE98_02325 [bacterium SCSIO 12741]|nr:hypothetical protein KFE98_02325 [bacterium SCSIO 12741]